MRFTEYSLEVILMRHGVKAVNAERDWRRMERVGVNMREGAGLIEVEGSVICDGWQRPKLGRAGTRLLLPPEDKFRRAPAGQLRQGKRSEATRSRL